MGKKKTKKSSSKANHVTSSDEQIDNNLSSKLNEDLTLRQLDITPKNGETTRETCDIERTNSKEEDKTDEPIKTVCLANSDHREENTSQTSNYISSDHDEANSNSDESPSRCKPCSSATASRQPRDKRCSYREEDRATSDNELSCSDGELVNNADSLMDGKSIERNDDHIFRVDNAASRVNASPPTGYSSSTTSSSASTSSSSATTSSFASTATTSSTTSTVTKSNEHVTLCDTKSSTTPKTIEESLALKSCNQESVEAGVVYSVYKDETILPAIMKLISNDLSEPYSIYTYRYFIHNWPDHCYVATKDDRLVGAIVCKLDYHRDMVRRGYIAMLAIDKNCRRLGIGSHLVMKAIKSMVFVGCDEVVLEAEITNSGALKLYHNLGFVYDKRLFRYYLNGVEAIRLKMWLN